MQLACIACGQAVNAALAAEAPYCVLQNARSETCLASPTNAGKARLAAQDAVNARKTKGQGSRGEEEVSRCSVCAGLYHTPCLGGLAAGKDRWDGATSAVFVCGNCVPKTKTTNLQDTVGTRIASRTAGLPLLVPAPALPYLRRGNASKVSTNVTVENEEALAGSDSDDGILHGDVEMNWRVFSTDVEVCTSCRQVEIGASDRGSCATCSGRRLHQRCIQRQEAAVATTIDAVMESESSGRKRCRSPSAVSASDDNVRSRSCAACLLDPSKTDQAIAGLQTNGSIETRTIALLVRDEDGKQTDAVQWWETCRVCSGRFCLHEFCDPQAIDTSLDEILAKAPLAGDDETGWCCGHCTDSQVAARDSMAAALAVSATDAGLGEELMTVLICDGCEREVDMATLHPPLMNIPDGDWFCQACTMKTKVMTGSKCNQDTPMAVVMTNAARTGAFGGGGALMALPATTILDSTTISKKSMEVVTVLICDGCDGEFDFASITPPLKSVPEGDWFCDKCIAAYSALTIAQKQDERSASTISPGLQDGTARQPVVVTPPAALGSGAPLAPLVPVTLLICDSCGGEFDMSVLDPPLTEVPSGDWYCPPCVAIRNAKRPGKTRRRRTKIGMAKKVRRAKNPQAVGGASAVAPVQNAALPMGAVQEVAVTFLICDGCEGEFDPLALNPPALAIPEGEWFCSTCAGHQTLPGLNGAAVGQAEATAATAELSMSDEWARTCVGCDMKFQTGTTAADQLRWPSESVDGVVLCEACRNLQVGYTRRRSTSSMTSIQANGSIKMSSGDVESGSRKRRRPGESSRSQKSSKKNKKSSSEPALTGDEADHEDPLSHAPVTGEGFPRLILPQAVAIVTASAGPRNGLEGGKAGSGWHYTNPTVIHGDSDDDVSNGDLDDDDDDDVIRIICDICFHEFKMADVLGDAKEVPARPWYCKPCLKTLKRNRKKKQRFSKQMLLEMQVYGRLLRPTAAKVVDIDAAARRGKPPNSREERRKMYELVGKSVGVFLQWDKQWVMGRVMAFHATHPAMHHTVRFDDGVVASLPLYAFPLVVGTRTMLYAKVPALQNRWWPAQVLRLNTLARKVLVPTYEEESAARANFRLVRVFASDNERVQTTHNVSCWVPKYLCRNIKRFELPAPTDTMATEAKATELLGKALARSVKRAKDETQIETDVLDRVFQQLLTRFRRTTAPSDGSATEVRAANGDQATEGGQLNRSRRWIQIAEAFVGKIVVVTAVGSRDLGLSLGSFEVKSFDDSSGTHAIQKHDNGDEETAADLMGGSDEVVYHLEDPCAFSELAIMLELSGSDARGGGVGDFHSKELLEKAIVQETGMQGDKDVLSSSAVHGENAEGETVEKNTCSHCLLGPAEIRESAVDANDAAGDEQLGEEELVVCAKCDQRYHATCCDPPYAPISLVNPEDGEVLVSDLKMPFVCSECTSCVGCHRERQHEESASSDEQQEDRDEPETKRRRTNKATVEPEQRWTQWRLPLQAAALCGNCVPFYETKRFCAVCHLVLDDEALATSVELLTCSTCDHWVHADCEPDPNPAFHAFKSNADFALDVIADVPDVSLNPSRPGDNMEVTDDSSAATGVGDNASIASLKTPIGSRSPSEDREILPNGKNYTGKDDGGFKPAKKVDEAFAYGLRFTATYDPKALYKYECLTCRKLRMLHVLQRLVNEDKIDLFKEPVTKAIAPTYFDVIKAPMDLSTMQQKILAGEYSSVNFREFRDDFELMCLNAVTFNSKERDFLIWREAWRFYGQGQKIFRQTAPKSRMKQRGGRHYDALLVAAKRQLPNNSAIVGKTQLNGVDSESWLNGGDDGDNNDEEDEEDEGEAGSEAGDEEHSKAALDEAGTTQSTASTGSLTSAEMVSTNGGDANPTTTESASLGEVSSDLVPAGSTAGTTLPSASTALVVAVDRRMLVRDAIVLQTKLSTTGKPDSRIPLFKITQTRTSAHTYCWLDMCVICGSAGLKTELIFCVDCGEGFHSFCVPGMNTARLEDSDQLQAYWRCPNCKMCEICGQPGNCSATAIASNDVPATAGNVDSADSNGQEKGEETEPHVVISGGESLLFCAHCDRGYHGSCLLPAIFPSSGHEAEDGGGGSKEIYCASCISCSSCSSNAVEYLPSEEAEEAQLATLERTYSYDRNTCLRCYDRQERESRALMERSKPLTQLWTAASRKRKKDSEKCPLCRRKWDADSEELMQCDACERWAHPQCDELLTAEPERYQTLVSDPKAVYVCGACRPKERQHLTHSAPDGEGWRCQVLIANIQRKRSQCDAKWKEARAQLELIEQWKRWAEHTPVYLYVLRLGEECLRSFAYRSLNFQSDWSRFTKQQELEASGLTLPAWLMRKASRYLRFKRYARGPRAAARRRERKTQSFYSQQAVGMNTRKDASAICPIVSEAASCAALLACVHLLYGWRPLPEVVLHLLSNDRDTGVEDGVRARPSLGEPLLKRLRKTESSGDEAAKRHLTLDQEIAAIKQQYDRRVAKRHLVREAASDLTLFGSGTSEAAEATDVAADAKTVSLPSEPSAAGSATASTTVSGLLSPTAAISVAPSPRRPVPTSPSTPAVVVHMTTASPLHGWPASGQETAEAQTEALEAAADKPTTTVATSKFEDARFCALCFMIGDDTPCGRLLYAESETWVHVNCALWSMEVYEGPSGVLHKSQKAKHRSRLIRCDGCELVGATVGCCVARCTSHYHFPCAVDAGVAFLPNGETCCPRAAHLDQVARRLQTKNGVPAVTVATTVAVEGNEPGEDMAKKLQQAKETDGGDVADAEHPDEEMKEAETTTEGMEKQSSSNSNTVGNESEEPATPSKEGGEEDDGPMKPNESIDGAEDQAVEDPIEAPSQKKTGSASSEYVLPVINPRNEPHRSLFSDPPLVLSDAKKKKNSGSKRGSKPRPMCYRVGALTVHSLGHVFVGNASFHTRHAIYPLGFRSTRIFWSTRLLATRCLYECVISSTEIEERHKRQDLQVGVADTKAEDSQRSQQRRRPRAVFKIVASDDQKNPIVATSPEDALLELRSRVVALYEEKRGFSASPRVGADVGQVLETERNPFLKRSSWFSFALSGDYFFGFGLPEIVRHIEQLPHAATAAVSRLAVVKKLRQQQQQQGQSPLASSAANWASKANKRSHEALEQEAATTLREEDENEEVYAFTQKLPSAVAFQAAQRVVEQLVRAEQRARQSSGCARTDGFEGNRLFGTPKKLKALPARRHALNKEASNEPVGGATSGSSGGGVAMDLEHLPIAMQYRELRRRPFDERLLVRKSSIHGYGLFLKEAVSEGQMIVEYQGQMIGQSVADERERRYEEQGIGSCYMFRLDENTIIDATRCGNLARFINHSCDPKAFARVVVVEGGEKKIVIFAKRAIAVGDEVTYDYKFPIEDEAIRCDCSAPNCIGRMN